MNKKVKNQLELRYYQREAVDAFFHYCSSNHGKHPIIIAPTGCISGDSIINENRCRIGRKKRIDHIFLAFNELKKNSHHNYNKSYKTFVRSLKENHIQLNEIEHVSYSGIKDVWKLILENNNFLKATPNHKIMTKNGWKRMDELTQSDYVMCDTLKAQTKNGIRKNDKGKRIKGELLVCNLWNHPYAVKTKTIKDKRGYTLRIEKHRAIFEAKLNNISLDKYKKILRTDEEKSKILEYVNPSIYDIHRIDGNPYNNNVDNLIKIKKRDHQLLHSQKSKYNFNQGVPIFSKVVSIEYYGKDHTYDIGCFKNHNFIANGIVVHNSGKSLIQATIIKKMMDWKDTRILCLTHVAELIKQNYNELIENFNYDIFLDVGIYSAGLKCRDQRNRILFAGIKSVYTKAWELGFFDLILIDESHSIPHKGEGMYRTFLKEMTKINPKIVIGGLSATPYRMKEGFLTEGEGHIFDDICYETKIRDLIDPTAFGNKDKVQYLCNLISKNSENKVDLSNVHIRGGEYKSDEMEKAYFENDLVCRAVEEIKIKTMDRKKILVFTAGIKHCEEVTKKLNAIGLNARYVHSKQSSQINDKNIEDFKKGEYKFLCNINGLTTGFNEKAIDCIVLLRSTLSPGLFCQICGRGFRMSPEKENCLILDFGHNIDRHGPIDKIEIRKKKSGDGMEAISAPQKECPNCHSVVHAACRECPDCGYVFPASDYNHSDKASNSDILSVWKRPEEHEVVNIFYHRHKKEGKPDSMRVDYYVAELEKYSEWICFEHEGFAKKKANNWILKRFDKTFNTVDEALQYINLFRKTKKIIVNTNNKFPEIIGHILEDKIEYEKRIKETKQKEEEETFNKIIDAVW